MVMDKALFIFLLTYAVIAVGQPPIFRIDRAGAALIGASLMLVTGVIDIDAAYRAVDYRTIVVLFCLMIVVANLRLSGFFPLASAFVMMHIARPSLLLYAIVFLSGGLSALFINDTVCIAFTPLVLVVTTRLGLNPVPFLLALCMASNIGSVATITGNPQNIMIGSFSGIGYARFTAKLLPVAVTGLVICCVMLRFVYRKDFAQTRITIAPARYRVHRPLLIKSTAVSGLMLLLFFTGVPMTTVAVGAAAYLLITRRVKPEKVYALVDWRLLVLFVGLFIVVEGVERSGLAMSALDMLGERTVGHPVFLVAVSAVLSNLVSNVPAVLLLKPVVASMPDQETSWLLLAMSSTLAGNLTILGSIANIIVIEGARPRVGIGFFEYLKVGIPLTIITVCLGTLWLRMFPY
ncbi:MAG TPA: anion transporter [Thermodesulfovibrionales bacterium]|nr:anion transporter [Thermodesulfovibrionales bacterium]